jgi:hypothetical protein
VVGRSSAFVTRFGNLTFVAGGRRLIERHFTALVAVATVALVVPNSLLSLTQGGGNSLLRQSGPGAALLYLLIWGFFSLPAVLVAYSRPTRSARVAVGSLLFLLLGVTVLRVGLMGVSPLSSDGAGNQLFLRDYSHHQDLGIMGFYNACGRPSKLAPGDLLMTSRAHLFHQEQWIQEHWSSAVPGNDRCASTPPLFFYLIVAAEMALRSLPGWQLVFTYAFAAGVIVILWSLFQRRSGPRIATLLVFAFVQCTAVGVYGSMFLNDMPALFFFFLGIYFLDLAGSRRPHLFGALGGLVIGMSAMVRYSYAPLVILVGLLVLIHHPKRTAMAASALPATCIAPILCASLGFNPTISLVTIPAVRAWYRDWIGLDGALLVRETALGVVQFLTALGFGWPLLVIVALARPRAVTRETPFWQSSWVIASLPFLLLIAGTQEPQRNLLALYPLILGVAMPAILEERGSERTRPALASGIAVSLSRNLF